MEKHMSHVFDLETTRRQQIIVEYLTPTGSGFGVTPDGEQVFMNKRLVDAMNVQAGDIYDAFLLPNYPDKRDVIPWRAMRVEPADVKLDLGHVAVDSDLENIIEFLKGYEEGACFTASEIADMLDMPRSTVEEICEKHKDIFLEQSTYCLLLGHK
jgi:hypothetical protein